MVAPARILGAPADPELGRRAQLEVDIPAAPSTGANEVGRAAVPVAVDGQLSRDGRFRWSAGWGQWVPTGREEVIDIAPLEAGPLLPDRHPEGCWCDACFNAGQYQADYLKNRGLWGNGGLK